MIYGSITFQHRICWAAMLWGTLGCLPTISLLFLGVAQQSYVFQGFSTETQRIFRRYNTFNLVYKTRWSDILRFRSKSLFTACEVCTALKQQLATRTFTLDQRLGSLKLYRDHLHSQYCDRTAMWTLQEFSSRWV